MSDPTPQPATSATPDNAPEARFEWTQSPFERFLEQHFKKVLILLLAVAAGVGAWLIFRQQAERTAIEQGEAFAGSETLDDYKKVISQYPGTMAAGSAQLMIANLLAENNDLAGALEELAKFTTTYPKHPMIDQAAFRSAVLTAEKDGAEAGVTQYDAFIEKFPSSPFRGIAQLRKADALASLGKRDEALALYSAIQKDNTLYGDSVLGQAKERAAQVALTPPTEVEFVPEPPPTTPTPSPVPAGLDFEAPSPAPVPTSPVPTSPVPTSPVPTSPVPTDPSAPAAPENVTPEPAASAPAEPTPPPQ